MCGYTAAGCGGPNGTSPDQKRIRVIYLPRRLYSALSQSWSDEATVLLLNGHPVRPAANPQICLKNGTSRLRILRAAALVCSASQR